MLQDGLGFVPKPYTLKFKGGLKAVATAGMCTLLVALSLEISQSASILMTRKSVTLEECQCFSTLSSLQGTVFQVQNLDVLNLNMQTLGKNIGDSLKYQFQMKSITLFQELSKSRNNQKYSYEWLDLAVPSSGDVRDVKLMLDSGKNSYVGERSINFTVVHTVSKSCEMIQVAYLVLELNLLYCLCRTTDRH